MQYLVNPTQLDSYLKNRFVRAIIQSTAIIVIVLVLLAYIFYKQNDLKGGLWSFCFSVPLIFGALLLGTKLWNDKLRKLSGAEFTLTSDSFIQTITNGDKKEFKYSDIVVINRVMLGTNIVKGNWLTKVDYYRPKKFGYQPDDINLIFIPNITTNYAELITKIKEAKQANKV